MDKLFQGVVAQHTTTCNKAGRHHHNCGEDGAYRRPICLLLVDKHVLLLPLDVDESWKCLLWFRSLTYSSRALYGVALAHCIQEKYHAGQGGISMLGGSE